MRCVIRQAQAADLAAVAQCLHVAARRLIARGQAVWTVEELSTAVLQPTVLRGEFYLAQNAADERVVGVMCLQAEDQDCWPDSPAGEALFVHRLAVVDAACGQGVAQALLAFATDEAQLRGRQYVRLDCVATRQKLRDFYVAAGFVFCDERQVGPWFLARYQLALNRKYK